MVLDRETGEFFNPSYFTSFNNEWFTESDVSEKIGVVDGYIRSASLGPSDRKHREDGFLSGGLYTNEDRYITFLCTGKQDVNFGHVYEGHIVRTKEGTSTITWNEREARFDGLPSDGWMKIIGHIEQQDAM